MIIDLNKKEISEIHGGGENYAYAFGRAVGVAIGGPVAIVYYAGKDLEVW